MPGTFSEATRPRRPGAYFNFVTETRETVVPATTDVVAVPFTHDWGPANQPVFMDSLDDFTSIFGTVKTTSAYRQVSQAFRGEGVPGRGGAGIVIGYRFGSSNLAKGRLTFQNTTPAPAMKAWARYYGTKGNTLRLTIEDSVKAGWKNFIVKMGGVELERYTYPSANVLNLAQQVNGVTGGKPSNWVTISGPGITDPENAQDLTGLITGVALANVANGSVAAGADGTDFAGGDVTRVLDRFELLRFGIFTMDIDPTVTYGASSGASIQSDIVAWTIERNSRGQRFETVLGGGLNESAATANTRSETFADPNTINVGVGSVRDTILGTLSPAQFAARVAGILAFRGERRSITFGRLAGVEILQGATESEIEDTFDSGTLILTRDNHPTAPVRIEKAITTYSVNVADERDVNVFGQPKFLRTMQGIEMEVTEYIEMNIIGWLPITDTTRETLVAELTARALTSRIDQGIMQPGALIVVREGGNTDVDYIDLDYYVKLAPSVEQVFNTVRVSRSTVA